MKGARRKEETKFMFVRALLDVEKQNAAPQEAPCQRPCRSGQVAFGALHSAARLHRIEGPVDRTA